MNEMWQVAGCRSPICPFILQPFAFILYFHEEHILTPEHDAWQAARAQLRLQMTRATFDQHLAGASLLSAANGTWQIAAPSSAARDWLETRLRESIQRAVQAATGRPVTLDFVLAPPPDANYLTCMSDNEASDDPVARDVADPELLLGAYLEPGGSGYAQVPHLYTRFWMPLLGPAYDLWLSLAGDDRRSLRAIAPDFWTPPRSYSYRELAARLGQQNPRCIYGYADECHHSRRRRLEQRAPLTAPADCCRNARWPHLRHQPLPGGGFLCRHWVPGRLEILHRHGLVRVQLAGPAGRKPTLQLWRLLPPLTPRQVNTLTPELQRDYLGFIRDYGRLFRLDVARWQQITAPSLLPLLPGYPTAGSDNFEQRRPRQDFLAAAEKNPDYLTCC